MANPIVIACHLIWTVYGWWLPNDLRGSTSRTIASPRIAALGDLHFGRKRLQPASRDVRTFYEEAAKVLKHPLLEIRDRAVEIVAAAFAEVIAQQRYACYACAIMPDHVHILIRKHKHAAEEMIEHLQNTSRWALIDAQLRPSDHPVWTGGGGWKVFLDHPEEVERTIPYIDDNPIRIRLPRQRWRFVMPYDRWPLHEGHSPNSPYVKRLRAAGRYP
jgi:REP element-mobilizing transposase RayT